MECCVDQHGTIIYIRALQGQSHGVVLFETDTVELEETHTPHGQLFQEQVNP